MTEYDILETKKFSSLPEARPSTRGKFIISRVSSDTLKVDELIRNLDLGEFSLIEEYAATVGIKSPITLSTERATQQALSLMIMAEMTKLTRLVDRDISINLPEDRPIEYFDFREMKREEQQYCTDNGRFLYTVEIEKLDAKITCESRNRYAR